MLGKASEINITDALNGPGSVRLWMVENPDRVILNIIATTDADTDYFYITYKEVAPDAQ